MRDLWFTLGPASIGKERELLKRGANGVRLTFSFRTPDYQLEQALRIRAIAEELNQPCSIVADIAGEKVRLGDFTNSLKINLIKGQTVRFIAEKITTPTAIDPVFPVANKMFYCQAAIGDFVTIGDGSAVVAVTNVSDTEVRGRMVADGVVDQNRGLTIQGRNFLPKSLTQQDIEHLRFIAESPVFDFVAISFVNSKEDIHKTRELFHGATNQPRIIAKIETMQGINNVEAIAAEADVVMAARGDLALSMPWVELPYAVEQIASACKRTKTPWILATQIMEGLERFAMPTRAEICDLAHWLSIGCSGALLSYETVFGTRPLEALACTRAILERWSRTNEGNAASIPRS